MSESRRNRLRRWHFANLGAYAPGITVAILWGLAACGPTYQAPYEVVVEEPVEATPEPVSRTIRKPPPPRAKAAANWEAFTRTDRALALAVERATKSRTDPARLASLRLARDARAVLKKGSIPPAIDKLERAVALDARNGFAFAYLAWAYHRSARYKRGLAFADRARRYLPQDPYVLGELDGLVRSLRLNAPGKRRLP